MPTIHLDLTDDDEFKYCQYCQSHVEPYNNTSLSTTSIDNLYTKTLLKYHHLNCEKCGLFIELHPKHSREEGLIFLCSNSIPHKHCLCYDCGLLYGLKTDSKKIDIVSQLQYNNTSQPSSAEIEPQTTNNNVISQSNAFSAMDIVNNTTFIAQVMNIGKNGGDTENVEPPINDGSHSLFIGTMMALLVWLGIYLNSPELFRLTGCFVWLSIFYFLTNLYFTENENIQRAVFGLFSFSPIIGSLYLFERSRRLKYNDDIQLTLQFFCIFGCIAYFSYYWSPIKMYLFLVNDFMKLSIFQQLISLFIAISFGFFILILLTNCKFLSTILYHNDDILNQKQDFIEQDHTENKQDLEITPLIQVSTANQHKLNETRNNQKKKKKRRRKKKKRAD